MFTVSLSKMLFIAWATLLGADEWIIREEAEAQMKVINNEYDCMDIVSKLTKSKDLEVKRRALRIQSNYFPEEQVYPLFQCYDGYYDKYWKEMFSENYYFGYTYQGDAPYQLEWKTSLDDEEQRNLTKEMVRYWITRGEKLKIIQERLNQMKLNETNKKFFNITPRDK